MLVRRFSDAAVTELHRLRPHILMDAGELGSRNVSVNWLEVPAGASEELRSHEEAEQVYVVVSGSRHDVRDRRHPAPRGRRPGADPARDRPRGRQRRHRALALVSVQSPAVSADELYSRRLAAQAANYDDYEDE